MSTPDPWWIEVDSCVSRETDRPGPRYGATPYQIAIRLEFFKPFPGTSTATYTFAPVGAGTKVTWAMDGSSSFMMKAFHLVVNMDKLLGADFERGLAAMKNEVEKPS